MVKEPHEIAAMRDAGALLADVIAEVRSHVAPGVSTKELDAVADRLIREAGAIPPFLGYVVSQDIAPFPASICASPNSQVVHGIPSEAPLRAGDIISLDFGLILRGYHADSAITVAVGAVDPEVQRLLDVTEQSLYEGAARAVAGNRIGDIGHAVQAYAEGFGYGVVRDYVGHGIGRQLHEPPSVPNYGKPGRGTLLKAGMVLAIEPMINQGIAETRVLKDGWTVVTADGKLSAHFEHTVLVTPKGPEILTARRDRR
jgi:methionyl aminopeptidase